MGLFFNCQGLKRGGMIIKTPEIFSKKELPGPPKLKFYGMQAALLPENIWENKFLKAHVRLLNSIKLFILPENVLKISLL